MQRTRRLVIAVLATIGLVFTLPRFLWAQGVLEYPQPGAFVSGIGFFSGWVCDADQINLVIDGAIVSQVTYGGERADTSFICEDSDNGFAGVINWSILGGRGAHHRRIGG